MIGTNRRRGLGLDLGASLLRACLVSENGRVIRKARLAAPRAADIPRAVAALKKRWKIKSLDGLVLGATGIWSAPQKRAAVAALRKAARARRTAAVSDIELAHRAAFGPAPGILILAGTGSMAYGRDQNGKTARAGGWGALLGDEGSGFWMGREALKSPRLRARFPLALSIAHGPNPARQTAALARRVIKLARKSRAAQDIVNRAARHLARLALETKSELDWRGAIPVSWTGGLFRDRLFLGKFLRALKQADPSFSPLPPRMAPERAAALWALRAYPKNRHPGNP